LRRILPVLLAAVLAATSMTTSAAAGPKLSVDWRQRIETLAPMAWKPRLWGTPALSADARLLYCPSGTGLSALATVSGQVVWQLKDGDAVQGRPAVHDGVVYVITAGGTVHALDGLKGTSRWPRSRRLDAVSYADPTVGPRHVYAMSDPGLLTAIDRRNGAIAWRYGRGLARDFLIEGHGAAVLLGDIVFAGMADGKLVALAARDGGLVWDRRLGDDRKGPYTDVDSTPVLTTVSGRTAVLAAAHNTGLFAHATKDGERLWRYDSEGLGQLLVSGDRVYAVAGNGVLHVVDLASGRRVFARRLAGAPSGRLAVAGGLLVVPTGDGLHLVDRSNGHGLSRIIDEFGFAAAPLLAGSRLFAVSNGGLALSLRLRP